MIRRICYELDIHPWELPRFIRLSLWTLIKLLASVVVVYLGTLGFMALAMMAGGV